MNKKKHWQSRGFGVVFGAVVTIASGLLVWDFEFSFSKSLKHLSFDQPFLLRPQTIPEDVVVVYLDDSSHSNLDQPYNAPWDRRWHIELINRLTREGAKAVIFDIIFSDPSPRGPAIDEALATAIEENGNVILAADMVKTEVTGQENAQIYEVIPPYELFDDVCADIGFATLKLDTDISVREHFHVDTGFDLIDSLTWSTARHLGVEIAQDDANRLTPRWVNFYGPPRALPHYSMWQVVGPDAVEQNLFQDKIVYVGAHLLTYNSGERKDEIISPWSTWDLGGHYWKFMAGVEVHATILNNLIRNDFIRELSKDIQLVFFLGIGLLMGGGLVVLRPLTATVAAVGTGIIVTVVAHYLHWVHRLWFPWMIVIAVQIPIAWAMSVLFNSVRLYVEKQLLEQSIRAYLSPKLVKAFANRRDEDFLKPGAKKQELSILFSDIEGFTSLSEGMDSSELANLMNGYFEATVSHGIHATDGTVVKYIGDAIFAFWNAPEPQSDHATRACEGALEIQQQPYQFSDDKPVHTRVGIHTGTADVGNFGSSNRVDYTAIGENINLASRLEGLNKYLGTRILISQETREAAADAIISRNLGAFRLKGFERTVIVHELIGIGEQVRDEYQELMDRFEKGRTHFQSRKFAEARAEFESILESTPDDGPSQFYLHRLEQFELTPPAEGWRGEIQLDEK